VKLWHLIVLWIVCLVGAGVTTAACGAFDQVGTAAVRGMFK